MRLASICVGLILVVGLAMPARAAEPDTRLVAETNRLFVARFHSWVEDIAGFNLRHAGCDQAAAEADSVDDMARHTTFQRTLGWRWDPARRVWAPATGEQAEIELTYSGPVRSGTLTIEGRERSFCRAEAPDMLRVTAKYLHIKPGETASRTTKVSLPPLASGFAAMAGTPPPAGLAPDTPPDEIAARIARAKAALEQTFAGLDRLADEERRHSVCTQPRADDLKQFDGWRQTNSTRKADLQVAVSGPAFSGSARDGTHTIWFCRAMRPDTATTSAIFDQEGETLLSFTAAKGAKLEP